MGERLFLCCSEVGLRLGLRLRIGGLLVLKYATSETKLSCPGDIFPAPVVPAVIVGGESGSSFEKYADVVVIVALVLATFSRSPLTTTADDEDDEGEEEEVGALMLELLAWGGGLGKNCLSLVDTGGSFCDGVATGMLHSLPATII